MHLRSFGVAYAATLAGLAAAFALGGPSSAAVVALLSVLEVALSFDNAAVTVTVLRRLSIFWQNIFLTVGIVLAVFVMRLAVPLVVLTLTSWKDPVSVVRGALKDPNNYGHYIAATQPLIAAFGGVFLLMIFMEFFLAEHDEQWLGWFEERVLRLSRRFKAGSVAAFQIAGVAVFLLIAGLTFGHSHPVGVPVAGSVGLVTYLAIRRLGDLALGKSEKLTRAGDEDRPATGRRALMLFVYLELLDATFSFDSVMGGFSVTADIALFTLGLGIGATYVRSLTVFLVRRKVLDRYVYLEHGAYYSIGVLAVLLLIQIGKDVPDWIASLAGTSTIVMALVHSEIRARGKNGPPVEPAATQG